ncbi:TetR/AcrR family transcriptional regulator [Lolliginicoccus suaedae]|uniref:TetR/AcrR family transcriptional regulator n=1 Tax=Lolliginicoccus suaedae TaxID=2605429 RepID=UPI0011EF97CE|nr:TetR/AcrR family transcriptional regulator [Lolliginicoccus suaedae]
MPAASSQRPRAAHLGPDRRRPQILDAALGIAVSEGVSAVTIRAVADRLDVTRPVVYSCFSDRVELIDALLDRESQVLLGSTMEALEASARAAHNPEDAFVRGYQALLRAGAAHADSWRLTFSHAREPEVADRFVAARAEVAAAARAQLAPMLRARATPDLERKLPVLVELFISSCEAAMRSLLDEPATWSPDELGELYGHAMWRAFSKV